MKSVELLIEELGKQDKKGFTAEFDLKNNNCHQLTDAVEKLSFMIMDDFMTKESEPFGWDKDLWVHIRDSHSEQDLLIIIAAFALKQWEYNNAAEQLGIKIIGKS